MLLTPFTYISSVAQFVPLRVTVTLRESIFVGYLFSC